ncbi:MAG TPA: hypothetical protein VFH16_03535 [Rubrobacter sp.]|jgi:hypothetical protein|nr:hypothetical protein [Rubrobacter sp.]
MTHPDSSPAGGSDHDGVNLRLLWPQWQGAGTSSVEAFASEFPLDVARRGYAVDVVGLTLAEFIPRQVMHVRQILNGFPLISGTTAD